ncbi:MAG TPA: thioredoxin family protein, partial [Candidatus Polarisedimenticolia bacterium]|nr:thioredoxin family protein [Candidatus Polarisedimenticolia bacterium]
APHQGPAGEISRDELWRTVPVWRARFDSYEPDPQVVAALKEVERDLRLTVVFGTWCGDSKQHVPELLKTVDLAGNGRIGVRLIAVRRGFEEPLDFVRDERVINVPTVIVAGDGGEIGRIVETPALDSITADLAAIIAGRPPVHQGRWERERRLARGTYHYLADGGRRGTEEWEIFAGPDDTTLIHSRLQLGARVTETWHRRAADNVTNFLEITRQDGSDLSRSRFWIEAGRAHSVTRGSATGIIEQTIEFPDRWTVLMPLAVDAVVAANGNPAHAFRFGAAGAPTSGRLYPLELEQGGSEEIATPAGRFDAARVVRRVDGEESVWWLHPELRVPVQGRLEDGVRIVLVEIERFTNEPAEP